MDPCIICRDPGGFAQKIETVERKMEAHCHVVEALQARVQAFATIETHMGYFRKELAEFKADRKDFNTKVDEMSRKFVTIDRYKWVERVVFLLTGTGVLWAINFFSQGG
jgi:hypothetical protein